MEREQLFCEQQLCFEAAGALYELEDALVLRVVLRLAAGLARHERAAAADRELRAPVGQERAVDALASQQRFNAAALGVGVGFTNDAQFLCCREDAPLARGGLAFERRTSVARC